MSNRFPIIARSNRAARDGWLIGCAAFLLAGPTPESLRQLGITGGAADLWVAALGLGAAASLVGLILRKPKGEIYGSIFCGFAMVVWSVGAVFQPHATSISYALACNFRAGACGQVYRALYIAEQGGEVQ